MLGKYRAEKYKKYFYRLKIPVDKAFVLWEMQIKADFEVVSTYVQIVNPTDTTITPTNALWAVRNGGVFTQWILETKVVNLTERERSEGIPES